MPKTKHDPQAVDAYLASLPDADRTTLQNLRLLIKGTVPDVQERVSYGTSVIFAVKRDLVGFVRYETVVKGHRAHVAFV